MLLAPNIYIYTGLIRCVGETGWEKRVLMASSWGLTVGILWMSDYFGLSAVCSCILLSAWHGLSNSWNILKGIGPLQPENLSSLTEKKKEYHSKPVWLPFFSATYFFFTVKWVNGVQCCIGLSSHGQKLLKLSFQLSYFVFHSGKQLFTKVKYPDYHRRKEIIQVKMNKINTYNC